MEMSWAWVHLSFGMEGASLKVDHRAASGAPRRCGGLGQKGISIRSVVQMSGGNITEQARYLSESPPWVVGVEDKMSRLIFKVKGK